MLYVGLDIHSKHIDFCVMSDRGSIVQRGKVRQLDQLVRTLEALPKPISVCYEVSCGYGYYHDLLTPIAAHVVAANPGRLQLIFGSKRKNDRIDAEKLAKLLLWGAAVAVHVPNANVRLWRELITMRRRYVQKRTRAKNSLRALLRTVGVRAPARPGLWTKAGMQWLKRLEFPQAGYALKRNLLVAEIQCFSIQIAELEQGLKPFSKDNLAVWQLRSIPGVGLRTAEAVVAFLDDPSRFPHSKKVGAYFGLVPSQDQSGSKNRLGHITREGSATVRQLLTEAVWVGVRRSATIRAYFERMRRNDPGRKKIAVVATAHYLTRVMWAMLRGGSLWSEQLGGSTAAALPWDPEAGSQARPTVPAAPHPSQTRRSRKSVETQT
jgi:transposase